MISIRRLAAISRSEERDSGYHQYQMILQNVSDHDWCCFSQDIPPLISLNIPYSVLNGSSLTGLLILSASCSSIQDSPSLYTEICCPGLLPRDMHLLLKPLRQNMPVYCGLPQVSPHIPFLHIPLNMLQRYPLSGYSCFPSQLQRLH